MCAEGCSCVSVIRFTVIDHCGATSFVGPCHAIKMLVAACSNRPESTEQLLEFTRPYDADFISTVRGALAVFDEYNVPNNPAAFRAKLATVSSRDLPPFRVLDDRLRRASLEPVDTGLIIINLAARRIIQIQNSYAEVLRADRGRVRQNGKPTRTLYRYKLPAEWHIVP